MKKTLFFCAFTLLKLSFYAQDKASLTKEETINYINKKLEETVSVEFNYTFEIRYRKYPESTTTRNRMFIRSNSLELNSNGTMTHMDKIASSLSACNGEDYYYGSKTSKVNFNPKHIIKVDTISSNDPRIGRLQITFLANTEKWEKSKFEYKLHTEEQKSVFSHWDSYGRPVYGEDEIIDHANCDDSWSSSETPKGDLIIYYFKSDPENGKKLLKAFSHLIALYKAEDDPFGE
jgi:hypothetical protein